MGIRSPLPGEKFGGGGGESVSYYSNMSGTMNHTLVQSQTTDNKNSSSAPDQCSGMPPTTPQIRTAKELEMSLLNGCGLGVSGGGGRASPSTPTILYSHANAEDLGNIYPWCKFLSKMLGVNIFAYDYTGYGLATDQGECLCWRNRRLGGR